VPGEVQTTKIAYTDGDDALTIADGGGVTTSGTFESGGAATLASLVCTAAGTFGGGYGATGATISTAGVIQANGAITSDGAVTGATLAGTVSTAAQNSITSASSLATVGTIGTGVWQGTAVASAYLDADTAHLSTTQTFTGDKTFTGTLTVGVDDTGKDVKFFGASAGAYMEWDESADQLRILGPSADAADSSGKLLLATAQTAVAANDILGQIDFQAPLETGTDATAIAAAIRAIAQGTFSASVNATDLIFYTGHSEAATEKFRMTSQGELGVGGANYGTDGQVLTSGGAGAAPTWADASGGSFSGPGSSTDNAVVRFNGTGGATGQNSGVIIDDSNNATGAANVTLSGELDAATGDFSGDVDIDGTLETDALTIGGTALLANDTNNRVTTATGSGTLNGEANLTFDGSTLNVVGNAGVGIARTDGTLHVHTATAGSVTPNANEDDLVVENSGNCGITILAPDASDSTLCFGSTSDAVGAVLRWNHDANLLKLSTANAGDSIAFGTAADVEAVRFDASGRLLVGSTASVTTGGANCGIENHNGLQSIIRYDNSGAANSPVLWLARTRSTSKGTVGTTVNNGDTVGLISFVADDGTDLTSQAAGISAAIDGAPGSNDTPGRLMFSTTADGAASSTERMRILSSGAIMVGKTASNVGVVGSQIEAGGNMNLTASADRLLGLNRLTSTGDLVSFKYAGSEKGSISTDGTNTAFNTSSDYRLKENIISLTGALTRVAQLQPRRFNFKETPDVIKDGFIAHEASTVVPEAVTGTKDAIKNLSNVVADADGVVIAEDTTEAQWTSGKEPTLVSEATEAVDAVLYVDGDEIPDGKSVGDVKTPAVDAADAVYDDPAYAADTVWHETLTVPVYQGIDQAKLVPLLTAAIQELTARVAALESA
jgi:hypothetical protein